MKIKEGINADFGTVKTVPYAEIERNTVIRWGFLVADIVGSLGMTAP